MFEKIAPPVQLNLDALNINYFRAAFWLNNNSRAIIYDCHMWLFQDVCGGRAVSGCNAAQLLSCVWRPEYSHVTGADLVRQIQCPQLKQSYPIIFVSINIDC